MNDLDALTPFTRNTSLVNFLPVPRYLFAMRLSSTALLLYILLFYTMFFYVPNALTGFIYATF